MTDRTFIWITGKSSRKAHIMNPETERTYCQTENVRRKKPLDGKGPEKPPGREICWNCINLEGRNETDYQEPSLAVLLGERIAEEGFGHAADASEGPDLFATAPKPRERERLPRVVRYPKARKPKRSKVKYDRPFDDPLPW